MKQQLAILIVAVALASCSYRPPKFADRLPVARVHDDRPIAVPKVSTFIRELYQADVYVRRELVNGLDPRRYPAALDVNSVDEVPASSWFRGEVDERRPLAGYRRDGPPQPPFELVDEPPSSEAPDAIVIKDARGLAYELQPDLEGKPRMRTGAVAAASRLVFALGYRTPEVHVIRSHEGERVAATRWPIGIDLGPTPIGDTRKDDPNDHISHLERRTLRAMQFVTAWLGFRRFRSRMLRDAYFGAPAKGHVRHYFVGLDRALGVGTYLDAVKWAGNPDREGSNFFMKVFSMGLSPKPPGAPPMTEWPSVGIFSDRLLPEKWDLSPPFEPVDRLNAGDIYWIAKRIAAIPNLTIEFALQASGLDPIVRQWLFERLQARRAQIIAYGFDQTTPCEVVGLDAASAGRAARLQLDDLAIRNGFVPAHQRYYRVGFWDEEGEPIAAVASARARRSRLSLPLPASLADHDYVVVHVHALRNGIALPRPYEVHLKPVAGGFKVVGARH